MIKPDIIISWPRNCDYPLWRQFIRQNRDRFNQVFIMFMETNQGDDFREYVMDVMHNDKCDFTQPELITVGQDWRNIAVNKALQKSTNDWVWFTEQDFFVLTPKFWGYISNQADVSDLIGVYDDTRLHPCCIFARRTAIEKTSKNFGIVPDKLDHFGVFQKEIENGLDIKVTSIPATYYYHMNGLSHNLTLAYNKQPITYHPDEFYDYLLRCERADIEKDYRTNRFIQETLPKGMR